MLGDERWASLRRRVARLALAAALLFPVATLAERVECHFHQTAALVEGTVEGFQEQHGRLPVSLDELVGAGFLRHVPTGPDGRPLRISSRSDGTWAVTAADGTLPPARWTCVTEHERAIGLALVIVVACLAAFVRTRLRVFLVLAALTILAWLTWATFTPIA